MPRRSGEITQVAAAPVPKAISPPQVEGYGEREGGVSLNDAAVIVSGGRGCEQQPALDAHRPV